MYRYRYVCIHMCIYIYRERERDCNICVCIYICIYIYIYKHGCMYIYIYIHTHTCVCLLSLSIYIYIYIYTYVYIAEWLVLLLSSLSPQRGIRKGGSDQETTFIKCLSHFRATQTLPLSDGRPARFRMFSSRPWTSVGWSVVPSLKYNTHIYPPKSRLWDRF